MQKHPPLLRRKTHGNDKHPAAPETLITLVGRLAADPALRHTRSGKSVASLSLAVRHGSGVGFVPVVVWGLRAEAACKYLRKGRSIRVTGRVQSRMYTTPSGVRRQIHEVVAWQVLFLPWDKAWSAGERAVA